MMPYFKFSLAVAIGWIVLSLYFAIADYFERRKRKQTSAKIYGFYEDEKQAKLQKAQELKERNEKAIKEYREKYPNSRIRGPSDDDGGNSAS